MKTKNFLKKSFLILSLLALIFTPSISSAEFWAKQSNGQLYTNSGNGFGNAIINVASCNGCGGGGGGGTVTSFSFTNGGGFTGVVTNPTTTPTLSLQTSLSSGSVPFIGTSGILLQDTSNFVWDDTNNRLGIGDNTPASALTVGSGDAFQVNSSGAIVAATGITSSGTVNLSGLTASKVVFTDGSKNLTSSGTVGPSQGGTGSTTTFTAGSAIFAGASGVYSQDNANFFWDDTNNRLGIGNAAPTVALDVTGRLKVSQEAMFGFYLQTPILSDNPSVLGGGVLNLKDAGSGNTNGSFTFNTTPASGIFSWLGNVGVGVASPSSKLDVTTAGLGVTQTATSGLALVNTTAAAVGAQQISPALRYSGFGWKTTSTAASQAVDFRTYNLPVQGTTNPTALLTTEFSVNGGAYSTVNQQYSDGTFEVTSVASGLKSKMDGTGLFIQRSNGSYDGYMVMNDGTDLRIGSRFGINFRNDSSVRGGMANGGHWFFGSNFTPTAWLHLTAGDATAGNAPLKFTSGTLLTSAEEGAVEFLTDKFYGTITTGAARKEITLNDAALTSGVFPIATTNGRLTNSSFSTTTLTAGTYTPTATNVTNITSSTPNISSYNRIGNTVTVFGSVLVTNTVAVASEVDVSLPIASNLNAATDLSGSGTMDTTASSNIYINADTTNDRARIFFTSVGVGQSGTIYFQFAYQVLP